MGKSARTGAGQVVTKRSGQMAALALLPVLAGCATCPPPAPRPVRVEVPIMTPVYCPLPTTPRPSLPVADLTADSSAADTVRAYAESIAILKGAVAQRDELIDGCRRPTANPTAAQSPTSGLPETTVVTTPLVNTVAIKSK